MQPDSAQMDLTECDIEPIRVPGAIQPHGALLAATGPDLVVTHVSGNAASFFGLAPGVMLGRRMGELPGFADDPGRMREIRGLPEDGSPWQLAVMRVGDGASALDAVAHRSGGRTIVEVERGGVAASVMSGGLERTTRGLISLLRAAGSIEESYRICARGVRRISGFDRVMVYRFDREWNGTVVAEDRRGDLESFLGLHYPASDIPRQARELYAKNWLRFIPDRDYQPVAIAPACGPDAPAPLDLGRSVLRSVSPVHLEYLRNMGVRASMSISLLDGDRLWGLVACHHQTPRQVSYDVRASCELLGHVLSMHLVAGESRERTAYGERMGAVRASLAERLHRIGDVGLALTETDPDLLKFIDSGGAAVLYGGAVSRIGFTPGERDIRTIRDRLEVRGAGDAFCTDAIGPALGLPELTPVAAGLLAVRLAGGVGDWLMWFRPEQAREVHWAGDPAKSVVKGGGGGRLSPRGSFALWREVVRGRSRPWAREEELAADWLRRDLVRVMASRAAELSRENHELRLAGDEGREMLARERAAREAAERLGRMKDEFLATVSHELRTPLNAIVGWVRILGHAQDPESIREAIEVIARNAKSQADMVEDLLDHSRIVSGKIRVGLEPLDLGEVVSSALDTIMPAAIAKDIAVESQLPPACDLCVLGDPLRLRQVFWNLLSNAVKFTPGGGSVRVESERAESHALISVIDSGRGIDPGFLPYIFDRFRQEDAGSNRTHGGLGLGLSIVRHVVELHGGTISARSGGPGRGAAFVVTLPLRGDGARAAVADAGEHARIAGMRVLVVDDEADARRFLRRILEEAGAAVGEAEGAEEALVMLRKSRFDALVSDIGMEFTDGLVFLERLRGLEAAAGSPRTPALALTAYAREEDRRRSLEAGFQAHMVKPVDPLEFLCVVASLAESGRRAVGSRSGRPAEREGVDGVPA